MINTIIKLYHNYIPDLHQPNVSFFSVFKVKYLREVTPYFKKASPLSDLGWGAQDSAQKDGVKANWSETKTIPLRLCYLCRNLTMIDPEKRTLELHSPDGKGMCALKFPDPATCSDWFNAIHSNMMMLTQQAILEANQIISSAPNQRQIRHMGWLAEQVRDLESLLTFTISLLHWVVDMVFKFA